MLSRNGAKLFDFAKFDFPEMFLSSVARDGRLPYWAKCLGLGPVLYCIGALSSVASGTFIDYYVRDFAFLAASMVLGGTLLLLVHTLRKVNDALTFSNKRLNRRYRADDRARFGKFVSWVRAWSPIGDSVFERAPFWYYLETFGGALLGSLVGLYWISFSQTTWWGVSQFRIASSFFVAWCAMLGYVSGACVFVSMGAIRVLRRYCKEFVTPQKILALNPDKVGGLKPFGQISLNLDIALSLPSTVVLVYLSSGVPVTNPVVWTLLVLYTLVLVIVFFVPISPAHDAMSAAKELAFEDVNNMFLDFQTTLMKEKKRPNSQMVVELHDLHFLYERVANMAVWPFDLGILVRFWFTALYPILGSLLVVYATKRLGFG